MTSTKLLSMLLASALGLGLSVPVVAQEKMAVNAAQVKQAADLTDGEVRRVDMEANKITIRHGPIVNLGMPAMTMVFQVKDPVMLEKVNPGDKIRFSADKIGGAYTVNGIEIAR